MMPGTPKEQQQSGFKSYAIEEKDGVYMAAFSDLPISGNEPDNVLQQRLDGSRDGFLQNTNSTLKSDTKITLLGKYPGRAIEAENPQRGAILRARVWIVNQRLYMLQVIGKPAWANSNDANKFLDSLSLIQ